MLMLEVQGIEENWKAVAVELHPGHEGNQHFGVVLKPWKDRQGGVVSKSPWDIRAFRDGVAVAVLFEELGNREHWGSNNIIATAAIVRQDQDRQAGIQLTETGFHCDQPGRPEPWLHYLRHMYWRRAPRSCQRIGSTVGDVLDRSG